MAKRLSKEDQEWQAQRDAQVLMDYQNIMDNTDRKKRAIAAAEKQAKELSARANALKGVTKLRTGSRKK